MVYLSQANESDKDQYNPHLIFSKPSISLLILFGLKSCIYFEPSLYEPHFVAKITLSLIPLIALPTIDSE